MGKQKYKNNCGNRKNKNQIKKKKNVGLNDKKFKSLN